MPVKILYPILPKRLFFVHIPKCAGTSLIDLLDSMYVQEEIYPNHYVMDELRKASQEELQRYRFFRGHFPVDLLSQKVGEPLTLITVLRDPVTRFISFFEMRQRVPDPLVGIKSVVANMSIEELIENKELYSRVFAVWATRLLGSVRMQDGELVKDVDKALRRLRSCEVVGLTERFSDTLQLLAWKFRWPPVRYTRVKNVSPNREKRAAISKSTKERIRLAEAQDVLLYEEAKKIFSEEWDNMQAEVEKAGADWWKQRVLEPHLGIEQFGREADFFDFRRVYPGQGWYPAETHHKYGVIRWSGPERISYLYAYASPSRPLELILRIVGWMEWRLVKGLKVYVNRNAVAVKVKKQSGGVLVRAEIPVDALHNDGIQEIAFEVPETIPEREDGRSLGLSYQWMLMYSK